MTWLGESPEHQRPPEVRTAELTVRAVAVESFTVVMATGIVAVAARDNGPSLVRCVFAAGAVCGLALIIVWLVVARIRTGRGIARGHNPIDRTFGLFGFVAATDVVAAQFDPMAAARTLLLVIALAAWVAVVTRLVAVLLASDIAALQADVRGRLAARGGRNPIARSRRSPTRPCRVAYPSCSSPQGWSGRRALWRTC